MRTPQLNAASVVVYQCSWIPDRWQWSVTTPDGPTFGGAATEDEAREQARTWARLNGYIVGGM